MVARVGDIAEGTINVDYKATVEVLVEVYLKTINRRNAMFMKSQITSQLGTLLIDERRYIISFARAHEMLEIVRLLQPTSKASWFNMKAKKILRVRLTRPNSFLWI